MGFIGSRNTITLQQLAAGWRVESGTDTRDYLFQAYVRDIGDIFVLVSKPVFVDGKHWGGFMLGLQHEALLQQQ